MSIALVAAALLLLGFFYYRSRHKGGIAEVARESTPVLDRWIAEALEVEFAEGALGMRRLALRRSVAPGEVAPGGEPDPDVVSRVEEKVKAVELEFVKYAHEAEIEVTLRVRYEDGNAGTATKRLTASDIPRRSARTSSAWLERGIPDMGVPLGARPRRLTLPLAPTSPVPDPIAFAVPFFFLADRRRALLGEEARRRRLSASATRSPI